MSAATYNELVIAAKRAEAAEEVVRALAARQEPVRIPTAGKLECCFCELGDQTSNGGGTKWHEPSCPWRRAVELVKEWNQ